MGMTDGQIKSLLAIAAAYDDRRPDRAQVLAWREAIADLPYEDARDAVTAYYASSRQQRIRPGDVRDAVLARRRDRVQRSGFSAERPPVDPDDVDAYQQWLRDGAREVADAASARAQLAAPARRSAPDSVRGALAEARRACRAAATHRREATP